MPLRIAVVGVGYLGSIHARKLRAMPDVELVAVVDSDSQRAQTVASELGVPAVPDHMELRGKVDAVTVATPTETHYGVAKDLLENGIHLLVEKPFTSTVDQANDLIEIAKNGKLVLQVGHLERFNPAVKALKANIDRPLFVEAHRLGPFKSRARTVDVVMDLMIHDIDILINLVGEMPYLVESVAVPIISNNQDLANARLKFPSGCLGDLTASRVTPEAQRRLRVFGAGMYASVNYATQRIFLAKLDKSYDLSQVDADPMQSIKWKELALPKVDQIEEEIKSFIKSIVEGTEPEVPAIDATKALKVAQDVLASAQDYLESIKFHEIEKKG